MGLDSVEIVLRTEELFAVSITDEEAALVLTVGDLYRLICGKLLLEPLSDPKTASPLPEISRKEKARFFGYTLVPLPPPDTVLPFSSQSVWDCLVSIFVDQMVLKPEAVRYSARIGEDLGIC